MSFSRTSRSRSSTIKEGEVNPEHLIKLVEERPVLWDRSKSCDRSRASYSQAWKEICATLNPGFGVLSDHNKDEYGEYENTQLKK